MKSHLCFDDHCNFLSTVPVLTKNNKNIIISFIILLLLYGSSIGMYTKIKSRSTTRTKSLIVYGSISYCRYIIDQWRAIRLCVVSVSVSVSVYLYVCCVYVCVCWIEIFYYSYNGVDCARTEIKV